MPTRVLEADTPGLLEILIERRERLSHLDCGAHGPQRIVLAHDRDAEHRHHGVADELLDQPAVAFDHGLHLLEVAQQEMPERLGVELPAHPGRIHQIGEEDRDRLAHLGLGYLGPRLERAGGSLLHHLSSERMRSAPVLLS